MTKKIKIFVAVRIQGNKEKGLPVEMKREITAVPISAPGITRALALHQGDLDSWKITDIESGRLIFSCDSRRHAMARVKVMHDYLTDEMIAEAAASSPPLADLPIQEPE